MFSATTPILAYHQVTKDDLSKDLGDLAMSASQFERQMRYLHDHGYRCLSLMELLSLSGNKSPREKTFVLTFDDGYEDFLMQAYPILRRYGFTATVFLATDLVGKQSNWEGAPDASLLTWEQVKALHKVGISFGSHTCTHPRLRRLSNEQIWHELVASKECLEAKLGQEIPFLAYSYGESNSESQKMAMQAGYRAACGVNTGRSGRFNLWRCECYAHDDNLLTFIFKLSRWYRYSQWLRNETVVGQFLRGVRYRWFTDRRQFSR